jgi:hypothetical protein
MGGLEDGIVVRRQDGSFQMIAAEMYAQPVWVAMRLGIWQSEVMGKISNRVIYRIIFQGRVGLERSFTLGLV